MPQITYVRVPEEASIAMTVTPDISTLGMTVYAYLVNRSGTATQVGSASGLAADAAISLTLDLATAGIDGGEDYEVEVVADPDSANPITLLPNQTYEQYVFHVFQVNATTDD